MPDQTPDISLTLDWTAGLAFTARDAKRGTEWIVDGKNEAGPGPVVLVGSSVAGCMGIDVVHILTRGRFEVRALKAEFKGFRAETDPISIPERFLPAEATVGHGHVALSEKTAKVENDDVTSALLRFANGAQGFVTASRGGPGRSWTAATRSSGSISSPRNPAGSIPTSPARWIRTTASGRVTSSCSSSPATWRRPTSCR